MTLLESCASIAILSLVVFFGAPSLIRARDNYQLDQVARQVGGNVQWTRLKAISRSRDCRFRVVSPASYVIECQDPVWLIDQTVPMPEGFRISANAVLQFHKRGNAAPAATITVTDVHTHTKTVTVNITGRVRVD
jgi:Tfp pilus assembly protein FimT